MSRFLATLALVLTLAAPVRADLSLTIVTTLEGGFAAMMGGMSPTIVQRIKGMKMRADIEMMGQTMSNLLDLSTRQMVVLNSMSKTAQVIDLGAVKASGDLPFPVPKLDVTSQATGKTQTIAGYVCEEQTVTMSMSFAPGAPMTPQAAAAMQDMRMKMTGSTWIARTGPGVAEYRAFQDAAKNATAAVLGGAMPQLAGSLDPVTAVLNASRGLQCLGEMTLTFEGSGPMAAKMQELGPMKVSQKVTAVSTAPLSEDLFAVPADYTVVKK